MSKYALSMGIPSKVVDGATGTGTTKSHEFAPLSPAVRATSQVLLVAKKTGVFTALTFDIEVTHDGGTTWTKFGTWDAQTSPAQRFTLTAGILHRLNCTTFTDGTSVDVFVTMG